jgi:hypothetical protein
MDPVPARSTTARRTSFDAGYVCFTSDLTLLKPKPDWPRAGQMIFHSGSGPY